MSRGLFGGSVISMEVPGLANSDSNRASPRFLRRMPRTGYSTGPGPRGRCARLASGITGTGLGRNTTASASPLAAAIAKLPGRKIVFTNGDAPYARRVLDRLGLGASFEAIHDIHAMALMPKPAPSAYAGLCAAFGIDPAQSLFADDMARNLAPAKAIGMTTVWVDNGSEQAADSDRSFIDHTTHDLTHWLEGIL